MEDRTFSYLTGRFRDYYRQADLDLPPEIDAREWGYIPWKRDGGTVMIRHKSLLEIGDAGEFLPSEHPRHVYTSGSTYEDPGAGTMEEKRWTGADLVFDIDIDEAHLPDYIEEDELAYADELALAKTHLIRLLAVLEDDFGFDDLEIVFSGGRGYHVHIRDPHVRELTSKHRTELVSYIQGVNLDLDALVQEKSTTVGSPSGKGGLSFKPDGGWSTRVHSRLVEVMEESLQIIEDCNGIPDEARDTLAAKDLDGVGKKTAETIVESFQQHENAIRAGHVNPGPGIKTLAKALTEEVHEDTYADIDEPVTTDINRLIRLPGSLHGRTGFKVTRIPRDEIDDFDPLVDAIPETFTGQDIAVRVTEPTSVAMVGQEFEFEEGEQRVPEAVGLYLMAQGVAEKEAE